MKKAVHCLILLQYAFGIYYDLSYVNFPKSLSFGDNFIPLKGRLKFLTFINLVSFEMRFLLLHSLCFLAYFAGIVYDFAYVSLPEKVFPFRDHYPWGGKSTFLTFWCMLLQTIYFALALLNDFVGTNESAPAKAPLIRKLKDIIFCALAFPIAIYVSSTFWALYAIDRELVFPRILDPFFPTWLNHLMHTNIMIFMILEAFVSFRKYPSRKTGMSILTVFLLAYTIWLHVIYYLSGFWVYPFLSLIGWPARICFYLSSYALGAAMYLTGEKLNNAIWHKQIAKITKSGKKKAH